jgi:protein involved in polysaccharide export with SLBB domain
VAKDKTCSELATYIKAKLEEEYYFQASVVLSLDQFNRSRGKVYISGYVRVPGALDIPSDEIFTLSKAILRAGGFNEFAEKRKVRLMRKGDTNSLAGGGTTIDVGAILEEGRIEKDVVLEPGDLIFVQNKLFKF